MYFEMKLAGLPEPEYRTEAFMVYATIRNKKYIDNRAEESIVVNTQDNTRDNTQDNTQDEILEYCKVPRSKKEITVYLGYKDVKSFSKNHLKPLLDAGKLVMTIPEKPSSRHQKYVTK